MADIWHSKINTFPYREWSRVNRQNRAKGKTASEQSLFKHILFLNEFASELQYSLFISMHVFFFLFLASLFRCFLSVMLKPIFRTVRPPPNTHTQAPSYHKSPFNWDKKGGGGGCIKAYIKLEVSPSFKQQ